MFLGKKAMPPVSVEKHLQGAPRGLHLEWLISSPKSNPIE